MKITSIKISGFRGVKNKIELQCSPSFVVITGRNGSGKSTLCDAIEYALTGTIEKYGDRTESKESIENYIWWRGEGTATDTYVTIGLAEDNSIMNVMRSANGKFHPSIKEVEDRLVNKDIAPQDALLHLCKTTIIRDEHISELSLDLPEVTRFKLVRSVIGTYDLSIYETKAIEALKHLNESKDKLIKRYERALERQNETTGILSETRATIERLPDIRSSESSLRKLLKKPDMTLSELIEEARRSIPILKSRADMILATLQEAVDLEKEFESFELQKYQRQIQELKELLEQVKEEYIQAKDEVLQVKARIKQLREQQPIITALGELYKIGEQLGRDQEKCRLCGSKISEHRYRVHLHTIKNHVEQFSKELTELLDIRMSALQKENDLANKQTSITEQIVRLRNRYASIVRAHKVFNESVQKLGFKATDNLSDVIAMLEYELNKVRNEQLQIDNHVTVLESTSLVEKAMELEREIGRVREERVYLEKEIKRCDSAIKKANGARRMIRRISNEMVDERLAAISPLLKEFYMRLRPHTDWQELDYQIRGDVRRFLSLRVGNDLNPSFMFSSGQRRAAGLAFLMTVCLSKAWSNLKTIVLDDPVQHIDDYRALHLVELLVAIRKAGYQIICTVEDPALANLLCRRLAGGSYDEGLLVEMIYMPDAGVNIAQTKRIGPLPRKVLLTA